MSAITTIFKCIGEGQQILVRYKHDITYAVKGNFKAYWILEKTTDGGVTWSIFDHGNEPRRFTTKRYISKSRTSAVFRFRCTSYERGTLTTTMSVLTSETVWEVNDHTGKPVLVVREHGTGLDESGFRNLLSDISMKGDHADL
jgi:hypothetical protein